MTQQRPTRKKNGRNFIVIHTTLWDIKQASIVSSNSLITFLHLIGVARSQSFPSAFDHKKVVLMSMNRLFVVACLCVLVSAPTFAQEDPFNRGSDPFAVTDEAVPTKSSAQITARRRMRTGVPQRPTSDDVEERLQVSLSDETSQTFVNIPLDEAIRTISRLHDIPIVLDRNALEEIGIATDTPINLSLKNISLRAYLRLMLRDLGLTYLIKDEVLQITTVEIAENDLLLKMHVFPKSLADHSDEIVRALQATVQPDTWDSSGGPSTVVPIGNIMAISANASVHDQVDDFFVKLDAAYEKSKAENE